MLFAAAAIAPVSAAAAPTLGFELAERTFAQWTRRDSDWLITVCKQRA